MQQIHQLTNKLSTEDIDNLIKNPLPPPIQFMDRYQNGDFGLLPIEIWDKIYSMKKAMELNDENERLIKEAENKIINCYYSWREQDLDKDEEENKYSYDNFDIYCNQIELEEYDDFIIENARERASKFFNKLYEESTAKINCIKKEMKTKKTFNKQTEKMQKYITKYLEKYQESNQIYRKNTKLEFFAFWDDFACDFDTKEEHRIFIKNDIIRKLYYL
tara:strand:+ start:63 stop:716 length:654 start_codon:yes stop_codon:yes gene_type:complete